MGNMTSTGTRPPRRSARSTISPSRVRQSRVYNLTSLILILWGGLIFAAYLCAFCCRARPACLDCATARRRRFAGISLFIREVRRPDRRLAGAVAFALLFGFGFFWAVVLGNFPARELNAFWATYWMLVYSMAGLWLGFGFLAIGLGISALTLIGYFFIGPWFELWMAFVNGGGLVLGGLWMRRT